MRPPAAPVGCVLRRQQALKVGKVVVLKEQHLGAGQVGAVLDRVVHTLWRARGWGGVIFSAGSGWMHAGGDNCKERGFLLLVLRESPPDPA